MREVYFINKNRDKWQKFEQIIGDSNFDPDEMADLYVEAMDDLSFARTFYSGSKTVSYLNQLSAKIHNEIFRNKKEDSKRIITFWTQEVPALFHSSHKYMLVSITIFVIGVLIGVISSAYDDSFSRLILGDGYVNMTIDNIKHGKPMDVYSSSSELPMFIMIAFNNIRVSFVAYVMGLLFSVGSAYMIFTNGIMLGTFQTMFYKYSMFFESFRTIWIHGTLEISAIIIAGGAGIILGNSLMFPGTFSRGVSFMMGAKKSIKILISLIPIFLLAAIFESFVTRHTEMPWVLSFLIIGLSLTFVIWYYILYPIKLNKKKGLTDAK